MPTHRHLQRLANVFIRRPVFFITTCTADRRPLLTQPETAEVLIAEWRGAQERHGWAIGRYVIMPDHVHFFASAIEDKTTLNRFVGEWKQWTAKRICQIRDIEAPVWQTRFFDHVLRSNKSYAEKWEYIRQNPVRAGLVADADEWPYAGAIHFDL